MKLPVRVRSVPPRPGRLRPVAALCAAASTLALMAGPAWAELRLPRLFSDHAVLQRDRPIHVWGWATPGATVSAELTGQGGRAVADRLGRWNVWLPARPAGGPYVLSVSGDGGSQSVSDLMLGDVWLASGQSNMEMPLAGFPPTAHVNNAAAEIAAANNPQIRLLRLEHRSSAYPLRDIEERWTDCTPETAARFSAIGYFFAREIAAREHVTVGVIDSSWGGTPADPWVSPEGLSRDPAVAMPALAARANLEAREAEKDAIVRAEKAEDDAARAKGLKPASHPWIPPEESWRPGALYNAMISPLTGFGLKGVFWYQGETNSQPDRAPYYQALFEGLIRDWRRDFDQGALPFLYVQISSFSSPKEYWGEVRDAQRRALEVGDTAMVTTTDVGDPDNVHPSDKQTVAARLALAARGLVYSEVVDYRPPLFRQAAPVQGGMRVWFDNAQGLTSRGRPLGGFEIAGPDHRFTPASAVVDHGSVLVTGAVADPSYVRFNWQGVAGGELYNAAGLPASTFTSEARLPADTPVP